ncbi:hypothetical protein [Streptomyces hawaiiensis]|uniref:hypothetical protein n=1 Tax=Streptomyces hawaiiensis TaxID=67305 RepID=UPI0036695526
MRPTPQASHDDGDGCTEPEEQLRRAGYALDGDGGCIAEARHHAITFLEQAHTDHHLMVSARTRDLTQLVVSELVTNALKYAPGPVLMERIRIGREALRCLLARRGVTSQRTKTWKESPDPDRDAKLDRIEHVRSYLRWRNANARHPDVLAAQRKERARIRSEKGIRWGGRPLAPAA